MTPEQTEIVYRALLRNDGRTLCPDWSGEDQGRLTVALDALRAELLPLTNVATDDGDNR